GEHKQLHSDSDKPHKVKLQPAQSSPPPIGVACSDESLSSRKSRIVLRTVEKISMTGMPRIPTAPPTSNSRQRPCQIIGCKSNALFPVGSRMRSSVGP